MASYVRTESLPGDRATVWAVVGDVTSTDNEHLASQEIIEGDGAGMVRRCVDTDGNVWTETCTLWEPGRRYRFDVAVAEHPLPMKAMAAEIKASDGRPNPDAGVTATDVTIAFEYRSKFGPLIDQLAKPMLRKITRENFSTWRRLLA